MGAGVPCNEKWLQDGPVVTVRDVCEHPEAFRNGTAAGGPAPFRCPLPEPPRSTVLAPGFHASAEIAVHANWRQADIPRLAATTLIAAPVELLRGLARLHHCEFRFPVVAFTGPCYGLLSESDRDAVWDAFGVPVYEQFLGMRNELLAEDCDVHDGLHILEERVRFDSRHGELLITSLANLAYPVLRLASGLYGRTEPSACECGRRGLKLVDLGTLRLPLAATA